MSGKVPPSSKARSRRRVSGDVARAAQRFRNFTGHEAEVIGKVNMPSLPKAVACMGELEAVIYSTVRDGKREKFIHKFKAADAPLLCVTPDGKQILLIGGRYTWTYRGIVDKTHRD